MEYKTNITSPRPVAKELAPSNNGNKMDSTSDGALSISSKTTQSPVTSAYYKGWYE